MNFKSKKAAIEMSMTTIVTIVLVVVTLVLALVLIRTIFTSSTNAIDQVNTAIQDQINNLFTSQGGNLQVYPNSRQITLNRGDTPKGFGFSIKNPEKTTATFSYNISAGDVHNCGTAFTPDQANAYVLGNTGSLSLGPGAILNPYILVKFDIPSDAVPCTIIYNLNVVETTPNSNAFPTNVFVTIN
jgi:archaellum component FlaG (FlaF/FlaG flagellin family)